MCKYCDNDYEVLNNTKEYSDIEISLYTAIKAIRVRAIFDETGLFKTQDVVKINFCPMCGRYLYDKNLILGTEHLTGKQLLEKSSELREKLREILDIKGE